jgi:hypothetical protein
MALSGLESVKTFVPNPIPSTDGLDVSREADETTAMLKYLGVVHDEDEAREEIIQGYRTLKATTDIDGNMVEGRLYVPPSIDVLPREELLKAVGYILGEANFSIYDRLWTPSGGKADGFTDAQLNEAAPKTEVAMALHSNNRDNPLLHFIDLPFDEIGMYGKKAKKTQLKLLDKYAQEFEASHSDRLISPLSDTAILGMVIEDRLAGRDTLPLDWGFMRVANLPRVNVGGRSFIGAIQSRRSGVRLNESNGVEFGSGGVGVSMGLRTP